MNHWIDNADSYICPICGFETNNPNRYESARCPKCGFQDAKDAIMDKAILVIDMPDNCKECSIMFPDEYSYWCSYDNPEPNGVFKYVEKGIKPDWCPLKPVPDKVEVFMDDWADGYNACLEDILEQ